jgi:hypothetical protein
MIVAFQAAKVGDRTFTSERHAPFGIPSTLACLYAGTFLLSTFHFSPECSEKLGECDAGRQLRMLTPFNVNPMLVLCKGHKE